MKFGEEMGDVEGVGGGVMAWFFDAAQPQLSPRCCIINPSERSHIILPID